jgi:VCBS repeat-containing protein
LGLRVKIKSNPNIVEFTLQGLSDDEAYFFVVTAYDSEDFESAASNQAILYLTDEDEPLNFSVISEDTIPPEAAAIMDEEGAPTAFSLTLNATDADGDTLYWNIATQAEDGTADVSGTGTQKAISYTPHADFNGTDSFTITVSDYLGGAALSINITINPVNDPPQITSVPPLSVDEDASYTYTATVVKFFILRRICCFLMKA